MLLDGDGAHGPLLHQALPAVHGRGASRHANRALAKSCDWGRGVQGLPRSSSHARLIGCCRMGMPTTLPAHRLAPCECGDDGCTLGRLEVAVRLVLVGSASQSMVALAAIARTQCARSQSKLRACACVNGGRRGDGSPACLRREVVHAVGAARWARRPPLVLLLLRGNLCAQPRKRIVTPSACHQRAWQASSVHAKVRL